MSSINIMNGPGPITAGSLIPAAAWHLRRLTERLVNMPRHRDFVAVPMTLTDPGQWDQDALALVLAYQPPTKQAFDNNELPDSWLDAISSTLNAEIWSFRHPDYLAVSATHGSAQLSLYDQPTWDKYRLGRLAGPKFSNNTLIREAAAASSDPSNFEDPQGVFSPANNTIPALMRRGVVFLACHHALWRHAEALLSADVNPDGLTHEELAAELTNHLIPGVILVPGMLAALSDLARAGFQYVK